MKSAETGRSMLYRGGRIALLMLPLAMTGLVGCEKDENKDLTQTIHVIIDTIVSDPNSVQDIDGNIYPVLQIGAQRWMGANLRSTHYGNGDPIPYVPNSQAWMGLNNGAWAIYESDPGFASVYGNLYNYFVVLDPRNVCPEGWHVPSDADWKELESELGMSLNEVDQMGIRGAGSNIGGKLKSTQLWSLPNTGATDSIGFEGLPGGLRSSSGSYSFEGEHAWWWTSTQSDPNTAMYRSLHNDNMGVYRLITNIRQGVSIRCLKD